MKFSARWLWPVASFCLLLSGMAGLAYQVAWSRYLALFLGHTSYAVVAVLVAFMAGLALGNWWIGRWADRVARPLALYGLLELGIAAFAVAFPWYYALCEAGYLTVARALGVGSPALLPAKFFFSFVAILLPTVMMGGTLPLLTKLVTRSLGELRARVAGLYFINSAGAVIGVVLADFWWLPTLGLEGTVWVGALLNILVGVVSLMVSRAMNEGVVEAAPAETAADAAADVEERYLPFELQLAVMGAGVSGFVAMLYEVVWTRLLALALGSSTHAFAVMLTTFISGIAVGAWLVGRWRGLRRSLDAFGWLQLALAGSLLLLAPWYADLPYWFLRLGEVIARRPEAFAFYQLAQAVICFAVMFIPTVVLGMTLPLATRAATAELSRTGRSVGLVFSVNTIGTVLGAALTGLWLMPAMGLARTLALGVAVNFALALVVLLRRRTWIRRAALVGAPALAAALVVLAGAALDDNWRRAFPRGWWRGPVRFETLADYHAAMRALDLVYYRDGASSTVTVERWEHKGEPVLSLRVNGKVDASTAGDLPTQLLSGHIPMLLHPGAAEVCVVGIGSGMTGGSILAHPEVRRLDAVEISPEVAHVARTILGEFNRHALDDPRTEVVLDDAKSFLKASGRRYDVIISEPSNPWMAGVSGVFSLEFYEQCRASLNPGGLMTQWVQVYETSDTALQTVLATFSSIFPYFTIWQTLPGDLILVGAPEPFLWSLETVARRFEVPAVREDLARADVTRLPVLLALQLVSDYNAPFLAPLDAVRHSDLFPVLEYLAQQAFFVRREATLPRTFDESLSRRPGTLLGEHVRRQPLTAEDFAALALFHSEHGVPLAHVMRSAIEGWRTVTTNSTVVAEYSTKFPLALPVSELEASRLAPLRERMFADAARDPELLRMYAMQLVHAYRNLRSVYHQPPTDELLGALDRLIETDAPNRRTHLLRRAEILWDLGRDQEMLALAKAAFDAGSGGDTGSRLDLDYVAPGHVLGLVIEAHWRAGRMREARQWVASARDSGFLDPGSRYFSPVLEMLVRKVEATAGDAAPAAAR
ncbi:MAG: fused MFS/spermidine synthase [Limisphaerales bacterium]